MKQVGYYNGTIADLNELKVPATDRALYFGDGCYDATTFKNNVAFALEDHLDRFYNSCRLLEIDFPLNSDELKSFTLLLMLTKLILVSFIGKLHVVLVYVTIFSQKIANLIY